MSEENEPQPQLVINDIFPKWLFISLLILYGFYLLNYTTITFLDFSLVRFLKNAGDVGEIINWLIYELRTGLTLWLFYRLHKGFSNHHS
jgi:hypothetical protein